MAARRSPCPATPPKHHQPSAQVPLWLAVDHGLVAVHLRRIIEHAGQKDVLVGHDASTCMFDDVTRIEVLEVGIVVGQVGQIRVRIYAAVFGNPWLDADRFGLDLALVQRCIDVLLEHLNLATIRDHDLTGLLSPDALHVNDTQFGTAR